MADHQCESSRAPELNSTATYADLFWLVVSAIPAGAPSWSSLLHFQIDPDCYPMDLDLPSAQRNTVVVSADGATLDYFEVQATLVEQNNPGGEGRRTLWTGCSWNRRRAK